jgi:hypothetical protein
VSVVHLGHLGESALSVQRISVQALSRELTVRKMERDVAELERLRRVDEERIRLETERLKAAEAGKTGTAASAQPGPQPFGPPTAPQPAPEPVAAPANTPAVPPGLGDPERRPPPPKSAERKADPFRQGASP